MAASITEGTHMESKAKEGIKNYVDSTLLETENSDAPELRGEVSIRSNDAKDETVYDFKPLHEDNQRTRRLCECEGKQGCMICGGKGFFYEMQIRRIYVAGEGWV